MTVTVLLLLLAAASGQVSWSTVGRTCHVYSDEQGEMNQLVSPSMTRWDVFYVRGSTLEHVPTILPQPCEAYTELMAHELDITYDSEVSEPNRHVLASMFTMFHPTTHCVAKNIPKQGSVSRFFRRQHCIYYNWCPRDVLLNTPQSYLLRTNAHVKLRGRVCAAEHGAMYIMTQRRTDAVTLNDPDFIPETNAEASASTGLARSFASLGSASGTSCVSIRPVGQNQCHASNQCAGVATLVRGDRQSVFVDIVKGTWVDRGMLWPMASSILTIRDDLVDAGVTCSSIKYIIKPTPQFCSTCAYQPNSPPQFVAVLESFTLDPARCVVLLLGVDITQSLVQNQCPEPRAVFADSMTPALLRPNQVVALEDMGAYMPTPVLVHYPARRFRMDCDSEIQFSWDVVQLNPDAPPLEQLMTMSAMVQDPPQRMPFMNHVRLQYMERDGIDEGGLTAAFVSQVDADLFRVCNGDVSALAFLGGAPLAMQHLCFETHGAILMPHPNSIGYMPEDAVVNAARAIGTFMALVVNWHLSWFLFRHQFAKPIHAPTFARISPLVLECLLFDTCRPESIPSLEAYLCDVFASDDFDHNDLYSPSKGYSSEKEVIPKLRGTDVLWSHGWEATRTAQAYTTLFAQRSNMWKGSSRVFKAMRTQFRLIVHLLKAKSAARHLGWSVEWMLSSLQGTVPTKADLRSRIQFQGVSALVKQSVRAAIEQLTQDEIVQLVYFVTSSYRFPAVSGDAQFVVAQLPFPAMQPRMSRLASAEELRDIRSRLSSASRPLRGRGADSAQTSRSIAWSTGSQDGSEAVSDVFSEDMEHDTVVSILDPDSRTSVYNVVARASTCANLLKVYPLNAEAMVASIRSALASTAEYDAYDET